MVPTTGSASSEEWSTGLFNAWCVGQAGTDNGVLLVIASRRSSGFGGGRSSGGGASGRW